MTFELRGYQKEANAAVHDFICNREGNPCVVLPTGSGKSVTMAALISDWYKAAPHLRGVILAHRKELVGQNYEKLRDYLGRCNLGLFAAGLGRQDYDAQILFASIDSIYKKAGDFPAFDFMFIDECHRIPPLGQGKYRQFIKECQEFNPAIKVVGWTATPYRMGSGPICHKDHVLNEVCYEAEVYDLIKQGFLCRLRSKVGAATPDVSKVGRNASGDYIVRGLVAATQNLVGRTIAEAMRLMTEEKRRSAIFFCVDVEHCRTVSKELARYGVTAPCITGNTAKRTRDLITESFKNEQTNCICCVNVLTEGFDAPHVDTIVLLRPTLSAGLFAQMVGRGLRTSPKKDYCLVLDFAGCIDEHGPLDQLDGGIVQMAVCHECRESFSRAVRICPSCGWTIPKREIERLEAAEEAERRMHAEKASKKSILSGEPEVLSVDSVIIGRHAKKNGTDSMKVRYRCGLSFYSEWICFDHDGHAKAAAMRWWSTRFNESFPTLERALTDMFLAEKILAWTKTVTVKREGRYMKVVGYNLKARNVPEETSSTSVPGPRLPDLPVPK